MIRLPPLSFLLIVVLATVPASAHGPTPKRLTREISLTADPHSVWALIGHPERMASWHPAISESLVEGGRNRGAERELVFRHGGTLVERIDEIDDAARQLTYRLSEEDVEVLPVSFYSNTIGVAPDGSGTTVTWTANFYRADTGNYPSEDQNDEVAIKAMQTFISQGLRGLKTFLADGS